MHNTSAIHTLNEDDINSTVWQYLENHLGPQYMPTAIVLPITVVYLLIFISGIIGNVIVCLVISRNSHFQTPTNYYIFSLAISDLLILLFGLPNDLKVYWQQYPWELGELVCKLRALIAEMTSYASVLTIVAFTMERYVAICHPLFIQTVSTLPRAIKFITSVWVISCLSAVPFACLTRLNYVDYPEGSGQFIKESAYCGLPMDIQSITRPLLQFATFAFFFLPLTVIIVLYVKISLKLRSTKFARMTYKTTTSRCSSTTSGCSGESRKTEIRRSVNKMLIAVVIAFFVCWAPFHAQRLLAVYVAPEDWTIELRTVNEILYYAAGCFYYFSATVNPILYTLMSSKYRVAFREALCNGQASKTANNNTSVFRNTHYNNTEMVHSEKETSLRISKQSFDADTTMMVVNVRANQLSVPGAKHSSANYRSSIKNGDPDTEDYVYIDPEGEIGDAKADKIGVNGQSARTLPKVTKRSKEDESRSLLKKDLGMSLERQKLSGARDTCTNYMSFGKNEAQDIENFVYIDPKREVVDAKADRMDVNDVRKLPKEEDTMSLLKKDHGVSLKRQKLPELSEVRSCAKKEAQNIESFVDIDSQGYVGDTKTDRVNVEDVRTLPKVTKKSKEVETTSLLKKDLVVSIENQKLREFVVDGMSAETATGFCHDRSKSGDIETCV